jgi:hypothetical protein
VAVPVQEDNGFPFRVAPIGVVERNVRREVRRGELHPLGSCIVVPFPSPTMGQFSPVAIMPSRDITRYYPIRPWHSLYNGQVESQPVEGLF